MNKADTEKIEGLLKKIGFSRTERKEEADLIFVNMCSVRQSAVDRVYGLAKTFSKLKEKNPKIKTLLTGCVAQRDLETFKKFFDFVLSIKTLPKWPEYLKEKNFYLFPKARNENFIKEFETCYLKEKSNRSKNFLAFVPVSTGCNNFCSFCIVPFVRGPLICRPHEEILEEAKEAIENGAKEIWLLGQNVNEYFSPTDKKINFAKLLKMVNEIKGDFWIRFASPNPKDFSDEMIETIAKSEKVTPYLNLPVQSGDNEILKKMNRAYTIGHYKKLVKKIRSAFKKYRKGLERELALSTDAIVGFPGETEKQFKNTAKLFKEIKFDMAYIAQYSPRPHTAAEKMKDNVPKKEKERRWKILTEILKKSALQKNKKFVGKEIEVLAQEKKDQFLIGKSRHYKTVKFEAPPQLVGKVVTVKITNALSWGLKGVLV